jgi:hypothetical protein
MSTGIGQQKQKQVVNSSELKTLQTSSESRRPNKLEIVV